MTDDRIEGGLKQGLGKVEDAWGGLTGDAAMQAGGKLDQASGAVQDAVGKVKDRAQDVLGQSRDRAEDFYSMVEGHVGDQPLRAIAITLGVGILIGLLLRGAPKSVYVRK
jgi:uncharacterized protein YjbJ (UPF0337 family)